VSGFGDYFTLKDCERILNRDRQTIRWHVRQGHVTPERIIYEGRQRLIFSKDDLHSLAARMKEVKIDED
jgi:hypothetical protein